MTTTSSSDRLAQLQVLLEGLPASLLDPQPSQYHFQDLGFFPDPDILACIEGQSWVEQSTMHSKSSTLSMTFILHLHSCVMSLQINLSYPWLRQALVMLKHLRTQLLMSIFTDISDLSTNFFNTV